MVKKNMGRTQQAVLEWVMAQDHPVDSTETGLALYDKVSMCAKLIDTFWSRDKVRRQWAGKILNLLVRRGYLQRIEGKKGYFESIKKEK